MMRDFYELATPVTINNSTIIGSGNVGTWVRDISLTTMGVSAGDIPAWATGVVFEIRNTTTTDYGFGVQSSDSTEDLVASEDNFLARIFVPLNATKTFDLYCGHLTNIVFKVIGFENFVQHVTPVDLSPQFLKGLEMGDAGIAGDNTGNLITVSAAPAGAKYALIEVRANKGMKLHGEGYSTFAMSGLHAAVSHVVVPLTADKTFWMHSDNYRAANPAGSPDVDLPRDFPVNGIRFIGWVPEENYEHRPTALPFGSTTAQNGTWVKVPDSAFGLKLASLEHASGASTYGWGVSNVASGGENWSREPKADVWVSPNANGELWVIRSRSYEQNNGCRARLTGGFIATPAGRITTVDGGDVLTAGATSVPVVGTGLASASYAKLVLHAPSTHAHTTQALSVSGVSDTGLTIDAVTLGKMPYTDANHIIKLQIFNSSNAVIAERIITLAPPAGYVVLPTADADALSTAVLGILKPLAERSQAVMPSTVTHGGSARAVEYELSASGYWTGVISLGNYQPATNVELSSGTYRSGDATDASGSWEALAVTLLSATGASDTVPDAFAFASATGAAPSSAQTSGPVTPIGYDAATTITVSGGEYRVNSGAWTSTAGTVSPGDAVQLRGTSPAGFGETAEVAVVVGGVAAAFSITTRDAIQPILSAATASQAGATSIDWSVTTDTGSGTLYVLASANAAEDAATIKASGTPEAVAAAGVQSGTITGLTFGNTYYVHFVHAGEADTAVASSGSVKLSTAASITLVDGAGNLLASTELRAWARASIGDAAVNGGTDGLVVSTNASGVLALTGLTVPAGAGVVTLQDPLDPENSHNYPVTFA